MFHLVNHIASVVVASGSVLHPDESGGLIFVPPCGGGRTDVLAVPRDGTGSLVLSFDPTAGLDESYAADHGDLDHADVSPGSLSIIYSSGELQSGDWIVIEPDGVTRSPMQPTFDTRGACATWRFPSN